MTDIILNPEQRVIQQELSDGITRIEETLAEPVSSDNGHDIAEALAERAMLAAYTPRIMEIATGLKGYAYGIVAEEMMNDDRIVGAKQEVQRAYIAGRMAPFMSMYAKAEEACKKLTAHLDQLRSLLSNAKEELRSQFPIHQNPRS